jgi:HSP20 family protein
MARGKKSFFERLTGGQREEDYEEGFEPEESDRAPARYEDEPVEEEWVEDEDAEGQLTVDVFQTPDEIVIKSIVAGVKPDDLEVSITRDMVTIRGGREESKEVSDDNYFHKELYWGSFSRTVLLPAEVDVEAAQASEKHGLLIIRLPKIDKERQTRLKVKSS